MFDPLAFWRSKPVVQDSLSLALEDAPVAVDAGDVKLKAAFPNVDPATLRTIVDEIFAVALAATVSRPIIHFALAAAQSIVDGLLPKVSARLQARGIKVG